MDLVNSYGYAIFEDGKKYSNTYEKPKGCGNKYIILQLKNEEETQYYFIKSSANYCIANYRVYKEYYSSELQVCYYGYNNMIYGADKIKIFGEWQGVFLYSKTEIKKFVQDLQLVENKNFWWLEDKIVENVFSIFTNNFHTKHINIKDIDVIDYFGNGKLLDMGYDRRKPDKTIHYLDDKLFYQRVDEETILVKISGNIYSKVVYKDKNNKEYINGGRVSRSSRLYLKETES